MDKLGQRLAFERTSVRGVRLYEAAMAKAQAFISYVNLLKQDLNLE